MEILKSFGIYEIIAVFIPGIIAFYFVDRFYALNLFQNTNLLVIASLSYVLGQLLQGVARLIEGIYWKFWGGIPTVWILNKRKSVFSNEFRERIFKLFKDNYELELNEKNLFLIKEFANDDFRLQIFNTHYGLFRALSTISIIFLVGYLFRCRNLTDIAMAGVLLIIAIISLHRMHTFSIHYAKRLFSVFVEKSEKRHFKWVQKA